MGGEVKVGLIFDLSEDAYMNNKNQNQQNVEG